MEALDQVMRDITLTNNGSRTSKVLKPFDVITDICKCGNEFDKEYKMYIPNKEEPVSYNSKMCWYCAREEREKEEQKEILKNHYAAKKKRYLKMFDENSLINPKLKQSTFDNYNPPTPELEKSKVIAARYAENFSLDNPVSLLFIGNYGTGKSHLSVAITKKLMEKEFTCIFISTPKLMSKIRSTYNKDSQYTEDQIIEQLSRVDCLVLDDIGAESVKQGDGNQHTWATSKIFEIIDNRIGKHTIFTSNYEPNELQARLGGRNFSRMMESTHVIKMYGDDYRLQAFK